jgi:hypothetical protein
MVSRVDIIRDKVLPPHFHHGVSSTLEDQVVGDDRADVVLAGRQVGQGAQHVEDGDGLVDCEKGSRVLQQSLLQIDDVRVTLSCDDVGVALDLAAPLNELQGLAVVMLFPPNAIDDLNAAEEAFRKDARADAARPPVVAARG